MKWILAIGVVALLGGFLFLRGGDSPRSEVSFHDLVKKEAQEQKSEQVEAGAKEVQAKAERIEKGQKDSADFVRPAIPEIPEFRWDNTRQWNLPLHNPPIANRQEAVAFMEPDDVVVGILVGRKARAYPWFVLANYHAVNDHIDKKPIILNFCEACNGVGAFFANAGTTTLDFRPLGIKNGTWYAIDFQTGSHWFPFSGLAFEGPLEGTQLERIPCYFSTWREWATDHPYTTVVLSNDEVRRREHGAVSFMANEENFNPSLLARITDPTPNPRRDWLESYELVFGLIPKAEQTAVAYPLNELRKTQTPIQTDACGEPVLIVLQKQYQVSAFIRRLNDVELTLEVTSDDPLVMTDQIGNDWDVWGRTLTGPDHPARLPVANGYLTKWYEWVENYSTSRLYPDRMQPLQTSTD